MVHCEVLEEGEKVNFNFSLIIGSSNQNINTKKILQALFYKYDGNVSLKEGPKRVIYYSLVLNLF